MPIDEHDVGLDQRLPWGRLQPEPARPLRRSPAPAEPAPAPADVHQGADPAAGPAEPAPAPAGASHAPVRAATGVVAVDADLQRSIEVLLVVLEGRMDRLEERLDLQGALLPTFLDEIDKRIRDGQPTLGGDGPHQGDSQVARQIEQIEARMDAVVADLKERMDRLQTLIVASHTTLIDAVETVATNAKSEVPPPAT